MAAAAKNRHDGNEPDMPPPEVVANPQPPAAGVNEAQQSVAGMNEAQQTVAGMYENELKQDEAQPPVAGNEPLNPAFGEGPHVVRKVQRRRNRRSSNRRNHGSDSDDSCESGDDGPYEVKLPGNFKLGCKYSGTPEDLNPFLFQVNTEFSRRMTRAPQGRRENAFIDSGARAAAVIAALSAQNDQEIVQDRCSRTVSTQLGHRGRCL